MGERGEKMVIDAKTDIGKVREANQDALYIAKDNRYCIIADGMGGHKGGKVASHAAIAAVRVTLKAQKPKKTEDVPKVLQEAARAANEIVYYMSQSSEELRGMGTTLAICYFFKKRAYLANVGDSRIYHLPATAANSDESPKLSQVTRDHTVVARLVQKGVLTEEQAQTHPQKNVITRAIGTEPQVDVDVFTLNYHEGDKILLCSDGLTDMLDTSEIQAIINQDGATQALIDAANANGGRDNVTAIIVRC